MEKVKLYKHLIRFVTVMFFVVKSDDGKGFCVELDFLIWSEQMVSIVTSCINMCAVGLAEDEYFLE